MLIAKFRKSQGHLRRRFSSKSLRQLYLLKKIRNSSKPEQKLRRLAKCWFKRISPTSWRPKIRWFCKLLDKMINLEQDSHRSCSMMGLLSPKTIIIPNHQNAKLFHRITKIWPHNFWKVQAKTTPFQVRNSQNFNPEKEKTDDQRLIGKIICRIKRLTLLFLLNTLFKSGKTRWPKLLLWLVVNWERSNLCLLSWSITRLRTASTAWRSTKA